LGRRGDIRILALALARDADVVESDLVAVEVGEGECPAEGAVICADLQNPNGQTIAGKMLFMV
jgi:hypothetical protein